MTWEQGHDAPMKAALRSPWLEIHILTVLIVLGYGAMALIGAATTVPEDAMPGLVIWGWVFGFFLISFIIAVVAVLSGIGGGVLFTPFMLAFTPVDSLIVRGTGLILAMFSGLISAGPFMRSGLANFRLCAFISLALGVGAILGSHAAIHLAQVTGPAGEGFVRLSLGVLLLLLVIYLASGGRKIDFPDVRHADRFTAALKLRQAYFEPSLRRTVYYTLRRGGWMILAGVAVGVLAGFYGLGAGWAIVPAQNLIMGVPLKVAAANSGVLLGVGNSIAVWPYIHAGAIIPLFAAPWLVGQVFGGIVGAQLLIHMRSTFVRYMLLGFMTLSCYGLAMRGLDDFGVLPWPPIWVTGLVTLAVFAAVVTAGLRAVRRERKEAEAPGYDFVI